MSTFASDKASGTNYRFEIFGLNDVISRKFKLLMLKINLPPFPYKLSRNGDSLFIFDPVRKASFKLTPEEWVRQHFINYLVSHLNYPKSIIKIENGLKFGNLQKRADIVVFDRTGQPHIIVECKAPHIELCDKTLQQISAYHHTLKARYIAITNGLSHHYFHTSPGPVKIDHLPEYQQNVF